ncbi:MAG: 4Fe-4S binding protein [Thermoplasmata archaeon]|nr:4Fe-4S binding protein [Thermoplasmata archaeon]
MRIRSLRIASQTFFFVLSWAALLGVTMTGLVYPYFFCVASPGAWAGCPLGTLEHGFANPTLSTGIPLLLFLFGFMGILVFIFGRGFCGWACPIGFLGDILYKIRKVFLPVLRPLGGVLTPVARTSQKYGIEPRYYKYIILVLIPITSLITGRMIFTEIDPIGGVTATIPTLLIGGYEATQPFFTIKMLLVVMWLLMGVVVMRSWCRFLCPLGAAMAPGNKVSLLSLKYKEDKCTKCMACVKACPMDINVMEEQRSYECILCGECVESCNFQALDMTFAGKEILKDSGARSPVKRK